MSRVYFGLDLGSSVCHGVAVNSSKKILVDQEVPTSATNLIRLVEEVKGPVLMHIEAGELSRWVYDLLKPYVEDVVVSHPNHSPWIFNDPNKDDGPDAFKLAEMARVDRMHPIFMTDDADMVTFKRLVQHYADLAGEITRVKCQIKARFRLEGLIIKSSSLFHPKKYRDYVDQMPERAIRDAVKDMYAVMFTVDRCRKRAKQRLIREAQRFPIVQRLIDQVPGVGAIVASVFVGYVQTPHRFATIQKLWRYAKLGVTNQRSNGKSLTYQRLDRTGNAPLKQASHVAAYGALRRKEDNGFKRFFRESLKRTGNRTHARLNTQRKMLKVMWSMWKSGEDYCDSRV